MLAAVDRGTRREVRAPARPQRPGPGAEVLGGGPGDDVLDLLARDRTGARSWALEARLRDGGIPVGGRTWSG